MTTSSDMSPLELLSLETKKTCILTYRNKNPIPKTVSHSPTCFYNSGITQEVIYIYI